LAAPVLTLAPLHGITNYTFRNAFLDYFGGFDAIMAPFIVTKKDQKALEIHYKDLLPKNNQRAKPIPQFLSNDPVEFLAAARVVQDFGYEEVNWNLGCPFAMVANKIRGSGLLPFPDRINSFLNAVLPHININISIKVRLGRVHPRELDALLPIFNSYPLKRVIIHPRVGVQMYRGQADVAAFAQAAAQIRHEVAYNGDIIDLDSYYATARRVPGIRCFMIGRGAIANPFLAGRIKDVAYPADPVVVIRAFHERLFADYTELLSGPGHVLDKMKEVWSYLSRSFSNGAAGFNGISRAKDWAGYNRAVRVLFEQEQWQAP